MSFHINTKTGRVNICRATVQACPLGNADEHYSSKKDAYSAQEKSYAEEFGQFAKKSKSPVVLFRKKDSERSANESKVIWDYREGLNYVVNSDLRSGNIKRSQTLAMITVLDEVFAATDPLKEAIVLKRSLDTSGGAQYDLPSIGVYSDPAYLSCSDSDSYIESTIKDGIDLYSQKPSDTILSIEVPAGAKILALSLENEDYALESEVILPRGSKMEILEDSGYINGVRRVRAKLILE